MALRLRQSFKLFPGVRVNLGMRGASASIGVSGATLNVSRRGVRGTVGIPGSGLSFSTMLVSNGGVASEARIDRELDESRGELPTAEVELPPTVRTPSSGTREIASAAVESLTSAGLVELRQMIIDARTQRGEIETELSAACSEHTRLLEELAKRKQSLFRWFFKRRIAELYGAISQQLAEVERLDAWLKATKIEVAFEGGAGAHRAYDSLVSAYDALRSCRAIWDVTSDRDANAVSERTLASRTVERQPVELEYSVSELISFAGKALRFANGNGEDMLIYPGLILMPRVDGQFALLDVREVTIDGRAIQFIENESIPEDTKVIGQTWLKVNKNGSPDRRFKGNRQIPICIYGDLRFTSSTGLTEEYQFSNSEAALAFADAYANYQMALANKEEGMGTADADD